MSGCQTCGGFGMHHDPVAHDQEPECNGICVMGNELLPEAGHYDVAAYPHPDCPRHGDGAA